MNIIMNSKFILSIVFAAALSGCGGGGTFIAEVSERSVGDDDDARAIGLGDNVYGELSDDLLSHRILYFAYDSSALTPKGETIIRAHAQNLLDNPNLTVILEGHTDERGTREYNLALAESRVTAVADVLQALGVDGLRMQTVSYGEERPADAGHNEDAWRLNRRVEILYQ